MKKIHKKNPTMELILSKFYVLPMNLLLHPATFKALTTATTIERL